MQNCSTGNNEKKSLPAHREALVIVVFCSEKRALAEDQACNAGLLSLSGARIDFISDIDILL